MAPAFIASSPIPISSSLSSLNGLRISANQKMVTPIPATTEMSCRRDLKKEKRLRNLEFARSHRKRPVRVFNRRSQQDAVHEEDNEFLSSIYGTIRFRSENDEEDTSSKGGKGGK